MSIDYSRARRTLARKDPVIRALMREHGACGLADAQHTDPLRALLHAIVSQQLSTKAAATITARVEALYGGAPTPGPPPTLNCARSA
jgi:DNA-3-methyladenine glycosylase II